MAIASILTVEFLGQRNQYCVTLDQTRAFAPEEVEPTVFKGPVIFAAETLDEVEAWLDTQADGLLKLGFNTSAQLYINAMNNLMKQFGREYAVVAVTPPSCALISPAVEVVTALSPQRAVMMVESQTASLKVVAVFEGDIGQPVWTPGKKA